MQTFYTINKESVPDIVKFAKEALCDKDPSVLGAALNLFLTICQV